MISDHAGVCEEKHTSGREDPREDRLSERQIKGWRAVFAAGLHGTGSCKRIVLREYSSSGMGSGFLRKSAGTNGRERFSTKAYRKLVLFLQKSSKISGNLREFPGECNLGILQLLQFPPMFCLQAQASCGDV